MRAKAFDSRVAMAVDAKVLADGLSALGLTFDDRQIELFVCFADLLSKWNLVYNLTAIRATEDILTHHLLDSASLVPHLARIAPKAANLLDVGSGGGLPAIPVAILRPDLHVLAVDAVGKKAAFIQQVAIDLGLRNLESRHARVESLTGRFDIITSRAFSSLDDFTRLTRHLLANDGVWAAMKGSIAHSEESAVATDVRIEEVTALNVPGLNESRHLYVMKLEK